MRYLAGDGHEGARNSGSRFARGRGVRGVLHGLVALWARKNSDFNGK
jgi:hypothetical protein